MHRSRAFQAELTTDKSAVFLPKTDQASGVLLSLQNIPMWGAPRIHGELLKLGIAITEPTVAKYMLHNRKPSSQTWRTFLENHVKSIVSVDFFTVPTIRLQVLYVFLVLAHDRRRILELIHFSSAIVITTETRLLFR